MSEMEKITFKELFQRLSVIGRVVSSNQLITVLDFRQYCLETYIFILTNWNWCLLAESLHRLLGHTWEMIVLNINHGLLSEFEQGSECSHKEERHAREHLSRKCDLISGDADTFRYCTEVAVCCVSDGSEP